jgi:hypothetical protein
MLTEEALRAVIAHVFEYLKADRADYLILSNELEALRNALQELSGGKFQPLLDKHRRLIDEGMATAGASDLSDYNGLIHKVKAGKLF